LILGSTHALTIAFIIFCHAVAILVPTRELALQTSQVCKDLGKHLKIQVMVTTGGTSLKDDIMRLYQPVHLLVGTPGRILDLAKKGVCILNDCSMLVMDEVITVHLKFTNLYRSIRKLILLVCYNIKRGLRYKIIRNDSMVLMETMALFIASLVHVVNIEPSIFSYVSFIHVHSVEHLTLMPLTFILGLIKGSFFWNNNLFRIFGVHWICSNDLYLFLESCVSILWNLALSETPKSFEAVLHLQSFDVFAWNKML